MSDSVSPSTDTPRADDGPAPAEPEDGPSSTGPGSAGRPDITVTIEASDAGADLGAMLESGLRRLLEVLDPEGASVAAISAAVVSDATMRQLHERHRGEAVTTDVLSFDLADPGAPVEADLVVCLDEARRQAAQRGHGTQEELLLYLLHGLLHTLGDDDADPRAAARMHRREDELLLAAGFDAYYAGDADDASRRNHS